MWRNNMRPEKLRKITRRFNRYRSPECRAEVVRNEDREVEVKFTGSTASFACCFDENFVDYCYLIRDLAGEDFVIKEIKRRGPEEFRVVYIKKEDRNEENDKKGAG